jgi:hypothetical protein
MSEANSPMFKLGQYDGWADRARVETCPSTTPVGPQPPDPAYPHMYNRGYARVMESAVPHVCTPECRQR